MDSLEYAFGILNMRKRRNEFNWSVSSFHLFYFNISECQILFIPLLVLFSFFNNRLNTERWPTSLVGGKRNRCMRNLRTGFRYPCCHWGHFIWSSENGNDSLKLSWFFYLCSQWRGTVCSPWKLTLKTIMSLSIIFLSKQRINLFLNFLVVSLSLKQQYMQYEYGRRYYS